MNQGKAAVELPGGACLKGVLAADAPVSFEPAAQPEAPVAQRVRSAIQVSLYEALSDVEADWREFEQRADCTVFQSFTWLSTWQQHIGQDKGTQPVIAVGRDERGGIVFILPLAVERNGLVKTLTWLGSDNNDYNAPLLAPHLLQLISCEEFLTHWRHVLQRIASRPQWRFDVIELVRMPTTLGRQPNPFVSLPVSPHSDHAYQTHLGGDWETYYTNKRSVATRRRDRTKRNRLGAIGTLDFITPAAAEDKARSLDTLIAQKTLSFARMGARNIFVRPGWSAFYRALASDTGAGGAGGFAHVSRLDVGPHAGAVNLGLVFHGTYYHLLASYTDSDMARFSPGAFHLHELMKYAIAQGCTVYDFTIGDETYKRDWSETRLVLFDHVSAARWRGAPVVPVIRLQSRLKRFIKQTPLVWNAFTRWRARLASLKTPAPLPTPPQEHS